MGQSMRKTKEYHELIVMKPIEISGKYKMKQVWIDDIEITPDRSLKAYKHSEDGFDWGNTGDGSAQLALAILLDITNNKKISIILHHLFKVQYLDPLKSADFKIKIPIGDWFYKNLNKDIMF